MTSFFHTVDSFIPESQELLAVPPDMPVLDALEELRKGNYSQVPVVASGRVLGVFSYRSFAAGVVRHKLVKVKVETLNVDDFLEQLSYAQSRSDVETILPSLVAQDAVLIGGHDRLEAIVTSTDVLQALFALTSAYLLLQEIELAIRKLIDLALTADQFQQCVERSLAHAYTGREDQMPKTSGDLSFGEYVAMFANGDNWRLLQLVVGSTREVVAARLEPINRIRNDVLHFRRALAADERARLVELRDWLFMKMSAVEKRRPGVRSA